MYDDTEAPSREEGLPHWSCRPLPAEPTENTEHVEDEYESFGEESSYGRIPFPPEREKPKTQAKQPSPSINSFTAEPVFTPASWKGFWRRNGILVVLVLVVGCIVIDMILLSQHAAMLSELRKLNFTPTTEICEPSTAPLNTEELKSTFIAEFRTLKNYIDQKYQASDRKMEGKLSRLEEELSAIKNRQDVCPTPKPLQWEEFGGSCYYFSDTIEPWGNAQKLCAAANSHLIIINSRTEQDFVVQKIKQTSVWLGLHDTAVEGIWRWVDGSRLEQNGYWKRGEPNDAHGMEDCAVLYKEKNWNDIPCDKNVHFVCEKSALS